MGRTRAPIKFCPGCGTSDTERFAKNRAHRDGLQTYCRGCMKSMRSWSKEERIKTVSQKKQYETALIESYIHHLQQE